MRVGVMMPVGEDPANGGLPASYDEIRQLALTAEVSGLDSVWTADHLFYEPTDGPTRGMWESWTLLSALAEATERVEIGNLVLAVPFRNPGLLAQMANTLDEVSGRRLVLGLGSGWHEPEFRAFGFEFEHRVSVFEDSLAVLLPLLRGGRVEHTGRFAEGHSELRPVARRPGGPPVLIASKGPRMQRLTARHADRWNTCWFGRPMEPFFERRQGLHEACRAVDRDPSEIEVTVGIVVADESELDEGADRSRVLLAEPRLIAEGLHEWHEQGVAEVMCT
ncbi:MAG TPA: LLM class flavin-dependent oxidoreductase, partial [Candidatus Caenarcaniphilales bacterium]|nr:LLM class flavin-dependent oxidoreductase [Candidatus Caenarcaniphilales bacterium]